jgi:hypothetical protein
MFVNDMTGAINIFKTYSEGLLINPVLTIEMYELSLEIIEKLKNKNPYFANPPDHHREIIEAFHEIPQGRFKERVKIVGEIVKDLKNATNMKVDKIMRYVQLCGFKYEAGKVVQSLSSTTQEKIKNKKPASALKNEEVSRKKPRLLSEILENTSGSVISSASSNADNTSVSSITSSKSL